jgi:DNA (cytosine-5)-methyltransferase 1
MSFLCIDCFAGAGGLSLGLTNAGIDVKYAFDNDPTAIATYLQNSKYLPHTAEVRDIDDLDGATLLRDAGIGRDDLFLVAGGPPCQGFSVQRIGSDMDGRNNLVPRYAELVSELRPKFFLMENVPGLTGRRGKQILDSFISRMSREGYHPYMKTLNAEEFGVPQRRKRVFVVGIRDDQHWREFTFDVEMDHPRTTVGQVIRDLPEPPVDGSEHPEVTHHRRDRLSRLNLERLRALKPGQGMEYLPPHLLADCHKPGADKVGHRNVYGRMAWNEVAPTITARFDSFTRGKFGHPEQHRSITLREGALLQTFPMDFQFSGNKVEIARQIGNAVPPRLAQAVGKMIIDYYERR